jgi:uncharacterized protein (DUF1800 family)
MTRYPLALFLVLILVVGSLRGQATDSFSRKLSRDQQVVHVLNRLAYGPRSGDVEEVRRVGIERWVRLQLNPERRPQNPLLLSQLKTLKSMNLSSRQIFEDYQQVPLFAAPPTPLAQLLPPAQVNKLDAGTPDERRAILTSLPSDLRKKVLLVVQPKAMEGLDDIQAEAFILRRIDAEERQAELRRLRPPITELLTQQEIDTVMRGTDEQKMMLLTSLDPDKRKKVLRVVPTAAMPFGFRREAMAAAQPAQLVMVELIEAKLFRAIDSARQLEEVLADFWLNHFNVFNGKGSVRFLLTSYERDAIRPHVFGRFRDMLLATARHPAMLFYLDNWLSQAPREEAPAQSTAIGAPARQLGLNENYGRELMELHTLGVDGGYTQADVVNVARAFTGWTIREPNRYGEFFFDPAMHDRNEKVVLGHTIPAGGGEDDGLKVIDILVRHPSTARFISHKLAQRFVADRPPQALVDRMAATFRRTDGDLRAVMETLVLSREFLSEGAWRAKVKSPLELVVSSLRTLNAEVTDTTVIAQRIAELGQPLYAKAEPTGYPNTSDMWTSSAGLLGRMNFASALASGQIAGVKVDTTPLQSGGSRQSAARLLGAAPSAATAAAIEKGLQGTASGEVLAAIVIASPDFQKR